MKENKIPTAEEFLNEVTAMDHPNSQGLPYKDIQDLMVGFAKLQVESALKAAHSNMQLPIEDLEFTLNSYPLENIK